MKNEFNESDRKAREELEPYKKPWGGYIFRLCVDKNEDGGLIVHSPELGGFCPTFHGSNVAGVDMITTSVQFSLVMNFGIKGADIYYSKESSPHSVIDGTDEIKGLESANDYQLIVVPQGGPKIATLPKEVAPKGTCPILKPAFRPDL